MKVIFFLLTVVFGTLILHIDVYATPKDSLTVYSYNIPDNAEYIDILIQMKTSDEHYIDINKANLEMYDFDYSKLVGYIDSEGYLSLSCHYKDNYTTMKIDRIDKGDREETQNNFILKKGDEGNLLLDGALMIPLYNEKYRLKVAVLDKNGSIIQTSDSFDIINDSGYLEYDIHYDVLNNQIELDWNKYYNDFTHHKFAFDLIILLLIAIFVLLIFIMTKIICIMTKVINFIRRKYAEKRKR